MNQLFSDLLPRVCWLFSTLPAHFVSQTEKGLLEVPELVLLIVFIPWFLFKTFVFLHTFKLCHWPRLCLTHPRLTKITVCFHSCHLPLHTVGCGFSTGLKHAFNQFDLLHFLSGLHQWEIKHCASLAVPSTTLSVSFNLTALDQICVTHQAVVRLTFCTLLIQQEEVMFFNIHCNYSLQH